MVGKEKNVKSEHTKEKSSESLYDILRSETGHKITRMYRSKIFQLSCCLLILWGVGENASAQSWPFMYPREESRGLTSYIMGVIYDFNGESEKAIEEFKKSENFADNYIIHLRLGGEYARTGNLPIAIKELQTVIQHDAENVQARYLLALIYSTQKEFDKAAQEYEAILKSFSQAEPENIEIYNYLGQLYYAQKDYPKAISQYEIILSLNPDNPDVMFTLGSLYLEVNKTEKAVELFSRSIKIDPDYDVALNSLGYVYAEKGDRLDEAQQLIERAIKIDPKNGAYLDSLGWVYYKKGQYDLALQYLKQADDLLKDPVIYEHMGDVYYQLKQSDDAKKYWSLSLKLSPHQQRVIDKLKSMN